MFDLQTLISQRESEWLDFKRQFHSNNAELLHDILCLSNSYHQGDRYIVFGVANDKTIRGVESDSHRKTNADLHDFLRQVHLNNIPQLELAFHQLDNHEIGLLRISDIPKKPFFLQRDFQAGKVVVRAGVVYTRLSDTNIPQNGTAPDDHIEIMWKERLQILTPKTISLEESLPIKLNDTRARVREVLGEPDGIGWQIEHYYSEGIELSYDQHFDTVDGFTVYPLPSGVAFEGTIFGIKLGDSFAQVKEAIGRPSYWGLAHENSSLAVWEIDDDKMLVVELWSSKAGNHLVPSQQLGTVKSIAYSNRKSFIGYNAMVAIAIEQIRRGLIPSAFERPELTTLEPKLDSPIYAENYELLGARPALTGGAEVLVDFTESKTLIAFWIYPLEWRYPVIRAIYTIHPKGEEAKAKTANKN